MRWLRWDLTAAKKEVLWYQPKHVSFHYHPFFGINFGFVDTDPTIVWILSRNIFCDTFHLLRGGWERIPLSYMAGGNQWKRLSVQEVCWSHQVLSVCAVGCLSMSTIEIFQFDWPPEGYSNLLVKSDRKLFSLLVSVLIVYLSFFLGPFSTFLS